MSQDLPEGIDKGWKIRAEQAEEMLKTACEELERLRINIEQRIVTCVYCGHAYPPNTPTAGAAILTQHIKVCEKHPMRALEEEIKRLRAEPLRLEADALMRDLAARDEELARMTTLNVKTYDLNIKQSEELERLRVELGEIKLVLEQQDRNFELERLRAALPCPVCGTNFINGHSDSCARASAAKERL